MVIVRMWAVCWQWALVHHVQTTVSVKPAQHLEPVVFVGPLHTADSKNCSAGFERQDTGHIFQLVLAN